MIYQSNAILLSFIPSCRRQSARSIDILHMHTSFVILNIFTSVGVFYTVSIHCAPEMSEIDCIGRIERFWPKFVRGW